jgi:hypothetical protein
MNSAPLVRLTLQSLRLVGLPSSGNRPGPTMEGPMDELIISTKHHRRWRHSDTRLRTGLTEATTD